MIVKDNAHWNGSFRSARQISLYMKIPYIESISAAASVLVLSYLPCQSKLSDSVCVVLTYSFSILEKKSTNIRNRGQLFSFSIVFRSCFLPLLCLLFVVQFSKILFKTLVLNKIDSLVFSIFWYLSLLRLIFLI